jgi:hypothetical protein
MLRQNDRAGDREAELPPGEAASPSTAPAAPPKATAAPAPPARTTVQQGAEDLQRRFEASTEVCALWKAGNGKFRSTRQLGGFRLTEDGSVAMTASGNDPQILLANFEAKQPMPWVVRIDLTSPANTSVQLFWRRGNLPYAGDRSVRRPITSGRNIVFIELNDPQMTHDFRLDPGAVAGDYILHSIEIRSCPKR